VIRVREQYEAGVSTLLCLLALSAFASPAWALTAPVAGSFAYDIYDITVNGILQGPIGFVVGVMAIAFGAYLAIRTEIMASILAILGGAAILKADTIVESLGAIV